MKNILSLILFVALLTGVSCKSDTKPSETDAKTENKAGSMNLADGNYTIGSAGTEVQWTGYKPAGQHSGVVPVTGGTITVEGGNISGGSFELDLANLSVTDVKPEDGKAKLEAHLKGTEEGKEDDFFNVTKFPKGSFSVTKVTQVLSNPEANVSITGDLTLKGQTQPVSFLAQVSKTEKGISAVSKEFKVDRTKWGLQFMSKSVFDDLKDKFINDEISLKINLSAAKS